MSGSPVDLLLRATGGRAVASGPEYDACCAVHNGAVSRRPAAVLRCSTPDDVRVGVLAAREAGVPLSVRSRGHDASGRALTDGGLTLDVSGMRSVLVDAEAGAADVAGGATAADVLAAAEPFGLAAVTGTAGSVGLAGLLLGGGYGPLSGRFGLAADNLLAADVVLADGSRVTVDAGHRPDLFWALRGGGGNFGVVTSLRVRLHAVPSVLGGMVMYPWEQAGDVLARLDDVLLGAPDELTVQAGIRTGPAGSPVVFLSPTWCGAPEPGRAALEALTTWGTPVVAEVGPTSVAGLVARTDGMFPGGRHTEVRTRTVAGVSGHVAPALFVAGTDVTSPLSALALHSCHGAAARVPGGATAVGRRGPHVVVEAAAGWEPGDPRAASHRAWALGVQAALAPHALPGGYANLLCPDDTDQIAHAYGANTQRLLAVKKRYDPAGVFAASPLPARGMPART